MKRVQKPHHSSMHLQMAANPSVWGPTLWRLLHTLADVSDRRDIFPLWNTFLKATCRMLPCERCQKHMNAYWATTTFMPRTWNTMSGSQVREHIRQKLWVFHNAVNERLEKPAHAALPNIRPVPSLTPVGAEPDPVVTEFLMIRNHYLAQVQELATLLPIPSSAAATEWRRSLHLLLQILRGGPAG
jgi:hypothetical protein